MGGYRSTRWAYHNRACTTNESFSFDLAHINMADIMADENPKRSIYSWTSNGKQSGSMYVYYKPDSQKLIFRFNAIRDNQTENVTQSVALETMPLHFGGVRYWMQCPRCHKRVRTLHCPPYANRFYCRACWQLSYSSSQDSRHTRGYTYEALDVLDKMGAIHAKLRRCHKGSKNHRRYYAKLHKLQSLYDVLTQQVQVRSKQTMLKINQLVAKVE